MVKRKANKIDMYRMILDQKVRNFTAKIDDLCQMRRRQGKAPYFGNYYHPAMAVCCCTSKLTNKIGKGVACEPRKKVYHFKMENLLKRKLGNGIGEKSTRTRCCYPIGQCAEPHAANNYLKVIDPNIDPERDLFFSTPYRPRTEAPIKVFKAFPYCDNCKTTFVNCR